MIDTPAGKTSTAVDLVNSSGKSERRARQFGSEADLETAIEAAKQRMCDAPEREAKLRHWREMCRLIDMRTPHRVRFMERMAGLA